MAKAQEPDVQEFVLNVEGEEVLVRVRPPSAYRPNPENSNLGRERGKKALARSLEVSKFHRGIFTSANDVVIGGNQTYEAALEADAVKGWVEIETKGAVGVATKRIDWSDHRVPEAIKAAYADNRVSQLNFDLNPEQFREDIAVLAELEDEIDPVLYTQDETEALLKLADGNNEDPPDDEGDWENKYAIAIWCNSERHQERVYNDLTSQGYQCKVMTL